jgi:hypothetical protein
MKTKFSNWDKWEKYGELDGINCPGVYAIALSKKKNNIAGKKFSWIKEIIYVGMTNHQLLESRLKQFDNTIRGKSGHGGAQRVKHEYKDSKWLIPRLYVSIWPHKCEIKSHPPKAKDLRVKGTIAKHEYDCWADYVEKWDELPKFNDKKKSPKK